MGYEGDLEKQPRKWKAYLIKSKLIDKSYYYTGDTLPTTDKRVSDWEISHNPNLIIEQTPVPILKLDLIYYTHWTNPTRILFKAKSSMGEIYKASLGEGLFILRHCLNGNIKALFTIKKIGTFMSLSLYKEIGLM